MIEVENLFFEYPGVRALDGVSCKVDTGSVTALVGANGAGKTTLMRCIAGLEQPLAGQVKVAGIDVAEYPRQVHRMMGYLSDSFGLYKSLTVAQCLEFAGASQGMVSSELTKAIAASGERLGLQVSLNKVCGELSRGWRQRVAIAQAIIHSPQVLILDEPASGLDPEARHELAVLFRRLQKEGMTILVSSHILAELDEYSTHMIVMREGKIIEQRALSGTSQQTLSASSRRFRIELTREEHGLPDWLSRQPNIDHASLSAVQNERVKAVEFNFTGDLEQQQALLLALITAQMPVTTFMEVKENIQQSYLASIDANKRKTEGII